MSETFGAQVKVLYAAYVPRMYHTDLGMEFMETFLHDGAKILEHAAKIFEENGIPVSSELVEGRKPVDAIVETVQRDGVDLIVISSHGLDDTRAKRLGSVTESVLRQAGCSVLLVK